MSEHIEVDQCVSIAKHSSRATQC